MSSRGLERRKLAPMPKALRALMRTSFICESDMPPTLAPKRPTLSSDLTILALLCACNLGCKPSERTVITR
eukprot:1255603-Amphidinium_carterae.1